MRKNNMKHVEQLFMTGELDGNGDDGGKGDGDNGGDTATLEKLKAENEALRKEKDAILKNKDEILAEKKKQDQAKRDADEAALKANADKAQNDKNFDEYKKSQDELTAKREKEFDSERAEFNKSRVATEATRIASRLAEGDNVELLSEFINRRIRYENGSMQILDESGKLTAHTLKDLEDEFTNSAKFASLLKGRKSSGGGAKGGKGGAGGEAQTVTRAEFDDMSQADRSEFSKAGGKVVTE